MPFSHSKKKFENQIKNKSNFLFYKKIKNFNNDPIPNFIENVQSHKYSFLYESVEKGKIKGRYSICGYEALNIIKLNKDNLLYEEDGVKKKTHKVKNPLNKIDKLIKKQKLNKVKTLPPMAGAFFGYLSYENIYNIENISVNIKKNILDLPSIILFIPKTLIIYDNINKSIFIIKYLAKEKKRKLNYDELLKEINNIEKKLKIKQKILPIDFRMKKNLNIKSNITKNKFLKNIKVAKSYIKNGDIFQVVPSQRFHINFRACSSLLYKVLRKTNPSPFMYYFNLPNFQIVGSSPEILVRLRSRIITIRPIAGTRPRGKSKEEDKKLELDLLADEKELAEHLMLLDLGRNDVGKVAEKSSVRVTAKFVVEKYSHVMHLVSNVIGKLKKNISPISALMAGFPAGTVSGAPKIRAMQIIDELEEDVRGIYAGGIGYISPDGEMDTCIVLRTGIINKNKLYVQAGGGVVYDSDPEKEYMETVNKAKAILNAASIVLGNKK